MPFAEIIFEGRLIERRLLPASPEPTGYPVVLPDGPELRLMPGQSARHGTWLVRVIDDLGPVTADRSGLAAIYPPKTPLPRDSRQQHLGLPEPANSELHRPMPTVIRPAGEPDSNLDFPAVSDSGVRAASPGKPEISGYEIHHLIAHGGMSTVWRATHLATRRTVALKVMDPGTMGHARFMRFRREIEILARLEHPNICRLYDADMQAGMCWYAMELIDGQELDVYVQEHKLGPRDILLLMYKVCSAVRFAHMHGIIHRDLKLSNVMVTGDFDPKVLDFGLAKSLTAGRSTDAELTLDAGGCGTPGYMAPEQAANDPELVDTRADVYGLGAMLYRLLTGDLPHDLKGSLYDVVRRIAEQEPRRPTELKPDLDPELEALLLKAVARSPEERYASVGHLMADLDNYIAGEPLHARAPTFVYLLSKRLSKYRTLVLLVLLICMGVAASTIGSILLIAEQRDRARAEQEVVQQRLSQALSEYEQEKRARADAEQRRRDAEQRHDEVQAARERAEAEAARIHRVLMDFYGNIIDEVESSADGDPYPK